jgi:hypothetical protein
MTLNLTDYITNGRASELVLIEGNHDEYPVTRVNHSHSHRDERVIVQAPGTNYSGFNTDGTHADGCAARVEFRLNLNNYLDNADALEVVDENGNTYAVTRLDPDRPRSFTVYNHGDWRYFQADGKHNTRPRVHVRVKALKPTPEFKPGDKVNNGQVLIAHPTEVDLVIALPTSRYDQPTVHYANDGTPFTPHGSNIEHDVDPMVEARIKWDALDHSMRSILLAGATTKKIAAIQTLRKLTGMGLNQAKRSIEEFTA